MSRRMAGDNSRQVRMTMSLRSVRRFIIFNFEVRVFVFLRNELFYHEKTENKQLRIVLSRKRTLFKVQIEN